MHRSPAIAVATVLLVGAAALGGQKAPPPPQPPVKVRYPAAEWDFGKQMFLLKGAAVVQDPINKEKLYIGGHNGGAPFGTVGDWALAEDGKTWREMKFSSGLDPLRGKVLAARKPAKDGEAAARNVFYAALDAAKESEAVKGEPAKLLGEALRLAEEVQVDINRELAVSKSVGWLVETMGRARDRIGRAVSSLKTAKAGFDGGKLDAALIKQCFDAQWTLDEAAAALAPSPGPREGAAAACDPENKCVVLFGGSHHDYMTNDTWVYDCQKKSWRQVWSKTAPSPRMGASFTFDEAKKALVLSGGQTVLNKMVYQKGSMPAPAGEWTFDAKSGEWKGDGGAPGGSRIYRTIVKAYDPTWYDAAPRGDPKATAAWLAAVKPNTWTEVPMQPAPAPERDWGTARYDPDRDQIYRWTGGHCADPSTVVSTYHPGINRWSIPYVAEIGQKGMTFNGRPDCMNHTYLHYAYDPVSKRLICASMGGTGVYNPDIGDFEYSVDQPFNCHIYETCSAGTSKGVILWGQGGQTWLFDCKEKAWKRFPVVGKPPAPQCDGAAMCYDSKRDVLWLAAFAGYQKPSGNIWQLDVKTGQVKAMNPANAETIGKGKGFSGEIRESVYVPTVDLVLFNQFVAGKEVAYDPEKNRWVVLSNVGQTPKLRLGGVSDTLNWDPKREVVWNLNAYKAIYVLKLDPKTLVVSEDPAK